MPPSMELQRAIRTAYAMLDIGHSLDDVLNLPIIPAELREQVRQEVERDRTVILVPATTITADGNRGQWLADLDRSTWYYWPTLRDYLIRKKSWNPSAIRSLDDASDRVLRQLAPPSQAGFDVRGLVLGFVQSGKTANFTALIAKAVDAGYRLIIVLGGIDNALRRQTNVRLKKELIGFSEAREDAVPLPPLGQQWHEFTRDELDGDFRPGFANAAALQGTQPVLLVVKKNGAVLRRLTEWLRQASPETRRELPVLVVDDEADQASIDTRGTLHQAVDGEGEYEPPSIINGLIRGLLQVFERRAYVAYTATPFANILIPHDAENPALGNDLYPRDFIVDLPKQPGYFGAEEFFGRLDDATGETVGGLDVIRHVEDNAAEVLEEGTLPPSFGTAVVDFVLAGAARAQRGAGQAPAAMLVHTSPRIADQSQIRAQVETRFWELRDEWRYQRRAGIRNRLKARWNEEQRITTRRIDAVREVAFEAIEEFIGPFLEAVQVREINSSTGEVLDYEREPGIKAIAVGGNRLSRGLTIEGLLVSYFVRRSPTYDTLMQMGRWFGFRRGYEDLTRIYTTRELAEWFADLALVEHRLRQDISMYEDRGLTPTQVGSRIWKHPTMQVTSRLKQRFATETVIAQSFDLSLEQTFKFPFRDPEALAEIADHNAEAVRAFADALGRAENGELGPIWRNVPARDVANFLRSYRQSPRLETISIPLVIAYLEDCLGDGELTSWTVAVRGRKEREARLGSVNWGRNASTVQQISRTRLRDTESIGVLTDPGDEGIGLSRVQLEDVERRLESARGDNRRTSFGIIARQVRDPESGLLLLYPVSKHSGHTGRLANNRRPLYDNAGDPDARDLVGIALSFPRTNRERRVEAYATGTVPWRPVNQ